MPNSVTTQIAPGQVTIGYYTIEDGRLVMTFPDGTPVESARFSAELKPGDDPRAIAGVMTKQVRIFLMGLTEEQDAFFNRPLNYQMAGIA